MMTPPQLPDSNSINSFRLHLIVLIAGVASVFVGGFAVYRYIYGPLVVALIDTLIVLAGAAIAFYAWRTGNVEHAGAAMAVVFAIAAIAVTAWTGVSGAVWIYTVILFVFYLAAPALGLGVVLFSIATIVVLHLGSARSVFDSSDQMASFMASATAMTAFSYYFAARNRMQNEQLLQLATRDPLTGLENRRRLEPELNVAVEAAKRHNRPYGLIIMDADNFKKINDAHGHAAGDVVLKALADTIASTTRLEDRAFRYGGDEFIIILPDVGPEGLETVSHKLVHAIESRGQSDAHGVTVSIGAALLRSEDDKDSWNRRADQHMYRAKERGGNRCEIG